MLRGLLIAALAFSGCAPGASRRPAPAAPEACVTLFAAGDILLDRGVRERAYVEGDPAYPLETLPELIDGADLAVANLECPLTRRRAPAPRVFVFRCDPEAARRLRDAGLGVVSLANNHVYDQGREAILDTVSALERAGIVAIGAGRDLCEASRPRVVERNGLRVAFLGFVTLPLEGIIWDPDQPTPAMADDERAKKALAEARGSADAVVVSVHWGREFDPRPTPRQLRWAGFFREHGADVILGHHPHVIQPVEAVNNRWTFYSLGNFVFDQHKAPGNLALAARITVCRDGVRAVRVVPLQITGTRPVRADAPAARRILDDLRAASPDLRFVRHPGSRTWQITSPRPEKPIN